MNRASFIKSSLLGSLGFSIVPKFLLSDYKSKLPYDELIGKGNPSLFGSNYKLRREAHLAFSDLDVIDAGVPRPNSVLNPKHFEDGGCFRKLKLWMDQNSESFGFYLVYTNKIGRKGFNYEPWHYSYRPLSQEYLKTYCQFDLKKIILKENLMGAEHFTEKFVEDYLKHNILDINPALL
ncbi:MAG: D-alanyl-D-alanine carboxypeptidase family protein [Bacteroidota bacterium]